MRHLTVIWAIIIFLLACVPCTDSAIAVAQEHCAITAAAHDQEEPAHADDLCSPLCECKCCGGMILIAVNQVVTKPQLLHSVLDVIPYLSSDTSSPTFPYWHPPKA